MNKRDFLIEVGIEEMPARFIGMLIDLFRNKLVNWLDDKLIAYGDVQLFSTPRRLAVLVKDVAEFQSDRKQEAKGPSKKVALDEEGNWSKAAIGFTKSNGMSTDDIYFKEIKGVDYAHLEKFIKGEPTVKLLSEMGELVGSLHFPNNMRWGSKTLRYVRPIRWIVALFGDELVPFTLAEVQSGKVTKGHRFLGEDIYLDIPANYEEALLRQYVMANQEERTQVIREQIEKLGMEKDWVIPIDEALLEEVTNLVEYPTVFPGSFNEEYLHLPEEVLITSMKAHQRYFPVKNKDGEMLPYFVAVRNGDHRHLETVARGNEKVLRARLADGDFFYNEDKKLLIEEALEKLNAIVYHEKIGTLAEKVGRVRNIANKLASYLSLTEKEKQLVDRAAEISKFDLVTNMVNEFPELQGLMGEKYALLQGEHPDTAKAINEHYKPRHADDHMPSSTIGAIISIADKVDSIVTAFAVGLIPTGSQDPYALRRQAAGIVQTLVQKDWALPLSWILKTGLEAANKVMQEEEKDVYDQLERFFKLRIKHMLQEKEISYDIIEAVLGGSFASVPDMAAKAAVLQAEKGRENFKETVEALSRVINISSKQETEREIDLSLFENDYEQALYKKWLDLQETYEGHVSADARFAALAKLTPAISAYFDHTMVMAEQVEIRENRLAQMKKLAGLISQYAAMNEIQVK